MSPICILESYSRFRERERQGRFDYMIVQVFQGVAVMVALLPYVDGHTGPFRLQQFGLLV